MVEEIRLANLSGPVIVFLMNNIPSSVLKNSLGLANQCYEVHDNQTLKTVQNYAATHDKGLIVLDEKYKYGVNIKFKRDAKVFILTNSNQIPDKEDLF